MLFILSLLLLVAGLYLTLYVAYTLFLIAANRFLPDKTRRPESPVTRFAVIIPAHNEEMLVSRLLGSLKGVDYPSGLLDVIVVADNCADATADIASSFSVRALVRNDAVRRGKGYAIRYALENTDIESHDAFFIVDADSIVDGECFKGLDGHLREGSHFIQCYNGVANPGDSWFTRLLDISRSISNEILEPAKEKLGLSSHLMGNGMCFSREAIHRFGWEAFTVGEDWEHYARIIQAGQRVAFARECRVYHRESSGLKQATPQRMRWASGRFAVLFRYGVDLLVTGFRQRDLVKLDASLPLVFPNPSLGINLSIVCFLFSLVNRDLGGIMPPAWFLGLIILQGAVFAGGVTCTREPFKSFISMFLAPLFLTWKMGIDILSALGKGRHRWIRTERRG